MSRKYSAFHRWVGPLLILTIILSACQAFTTPTPIRIPTIAPVLPETGMTPMVVINNQSSDGRSVVVSEVVSQGPGWIAIHRQEANGSTGAAIGHSPVQAGDNRNVVVQLDSTQVTGTMYAMLHQDAGQVGVYEFPGPDTPIFVSGVMVSPSFQWTKGTANQKLPTVVVSNQDTKSGVVKITDVVSGGPGWVAIHIQNADGTAGEEIGYVHVNDGDNQNVVVNIDPTKVTPVLFAMLHIDAGEIGTYEYPGPDTPQMVAGNMVAPTFNSSLTSTANTTQMPMASEATTEPPGEVYAATTEPPGETYVTTPEATQSAMPMANPTEMMTATAPGMVMATPMPGMQPAVDVSDQQVVSGTVTISKVVSNGPGWIVVYTAVNDQPGTPIGDTAVKDGENDNVVVNVDQSKVTPRLFALLHVDMGEVGKFEFPGPDAPLMIGVQMIQKSFSTQVAAAATTTPNDQPMVKINDQVIRAGTLKIAEVFSKGPGWIGMHIQNPDGSVGSPIGDVHVLDGLNKDLVVKIDVNRATPTMYAMLHTDAGNEGVWEFPGPDVPVMVNNDMVMPSFKVIGGLPKDSTVINLGQSTGLSPFLVDEAGNTLYISFADTPGKSNCDATCRTKWLPLIVTARLQVGDGVNVSKLGIIVLPDGSRQVTYGGQPLYYYYADNAPGDVGGQGVDGMWFTSPP